MRHFVIDQLSREEREAVTAYLQENAQHGPINDLFWLPLPEELLNSEQNEHARCGPFYLAVEIGEDSATFELLVRSQSTLHCSCIAYTTSPQRDYLLHFIDTMIDQLHLLA